MIGLTGFEKLVIWAWALRLHFCYVVFEKKWRYLGEGGTQVFNSRLNVSKSPTKGVKGL